MSAAALLADKPRPTDEDIDAAMVDNYCRCGTYNRIRKAIHLASENNPSQFLDASLGTSDFHVNEQSEGQS